MWLSMLAEAASADPRQQIKASGPSFRLVDQHGRPVTEEDLADKPAVLHFGFTHCPVVCPTTLHEIAERMRRMGPAAHDLRFVFVTVDPDRDTSAVLEPYIASFDSRIIGLTGSADQIKALADGVGAPFSRATATDGSYTLDHSVFGFLMARGWKRAGVLYMGSDARTELVGNILQRLVRP